MNAVFSALSGSGVFTGFRILEIPVMLRTLPVFLEHAHLRVIQFRGWLWSADQPPVVSGSLGWWPKSDDQGKDVVVIGIFVACRKGHKNRRNLYTSFFFSDFARGAASFASPRAGPATQLESDTK